MSSWGQWPTPSSSAASACGCQSSRKRAAADGHGRSLSSAPHTTRTGQVILSASRRQPSRSACSIQWPYRLAGCGAAYQVGKQFGRDVLEVRGDEVRRSAPTLFGGDDLVGVRHDGFQLFVHLRLERERLLERLVTSGPAGRRAFADTCFPSTRRRGRRPGGRTASQHGARRTRRSSPCRRVRRDSTGWLEPGEDGCGMRRSQRDRPRPSGERARAAGSGRHRHRPRVAVVRVKVPANRRPDPSRRGNGRAQAFGQLGSRSG